MIPTRSIFSNKLLFIYRMFSLFLSLAYFIGLNNGVYFANNQCVKPNDIQTQVTYTSSRNELDCARKCKEAKSCETFFFLKDDQSDDKSCALVPQDYQLPSADIPCGGPAGHVAIWTKQTDVKERVNIYYWLLTLTNERFCLKTFKVIVLIMIRPKQKKYLFTGTRPTLENGPTLFF